MLRLASSKTPLAQVLLPRPRRCRPASLAAAWLLLLLLALLR